MSPRIHVPCGRVVNAENAETHKMQCAICKMRIKAREIGGKS